jgi:pSer/pThr/pTyr-binding forkhead associated (FHA) protein
VWAGVWRRRSSRRHAGFERVDGQWYVTDLDSTNGTYVDGVQVQRAPIKAGSRVRLGDSILDVV